MAFVLQRTDHVEREKHDGAVRAAMKAQIALTIAVETLLGDQRLEHAALGTPPRDALIDSSRPVTGSG